eukprot:3894074-Rhodomonas_salina.1
MHPETQYKKPHYPYDLYQACDPGNTLTDTFRTCARTFRTQACTGPRMFRTWIRPARCGLAPLASWPGLGVEAAVKDSSEGLGLRKPSAGSLATSPPRQQ